MPCRALAGHDIWVRPSIFKANGVPAATSDPTAFTNLPESLAMLRVSRDIPNKAPNSSIGLPAMLFSAVFSRLAPSIGVGSN